MSTHLVINTATGQAEQRELSSQEVADLLPQAPPNPQDVFRSFIAAGFEVTPEGFRLAMGDRDRAQFGDMLTLVNTALGAGAITGSTQQTIADMTGETHTVTTTRFIQIMLAYGAAYSAAWAEQKTAS